MAGREIKTTLAIDGEQKYKRAIDEAKGSLRNLGTQLTLATAEFKKDGDAMKLVETRSKALKAEIEQQQAIVKSLEGAVEDATQAYGENSRQADKWQADLNRARATLANLETELRNNEQGLDKNGKAFAQAGQAAGKFGQDVQSAARTANATSFQALNTSLDNVSRTLSGVFTGIGKLGKMGWNFVSDAAAQADELITKARQLGIDTDTLQKWELAGKLIDTDAETMAKAMDKLLNPSDALRQAMRALGVASKEWRTTERGTREYVNKDTVTLFWDLVEAMDAMGSADAQNAVASELFGKSYRQLLPLIEKGREGWEAAGEGALIAGEDTLSALSGFNDALDTLSQNWNELKLTIAGELAGPLQSIADTFGELIKKFDEWAKSEAGQEALSKLGGAIESVFTSFTENVDFESIVDGITGAIQGFTGALDWVSDNSDVVIKGIQGIVAALIALKGIQFSTSLVNLVKGLKDVVSGGGAAAAGSGAGSGSLLSGFAKLLGKISAIGLGSALGWNLGGLTTFNWGTWSFEQGSGFTPIAATEDDALFDRNGNVTEMGRRQGITANTIDQALAMGQPTTWGDIYDLQNAKRAAQAQREAEMEAAAETAWVLSNYMAGLETSNISDIGELSDEALAALAQRIFDLGLSSGFAHDFESLDDLYRALKNEERDQAAGEAHPDWRSMSAEDMMAYYRQIGGVTGPDWMSAEEYAELRAAANLAYQAAQQTEEQRLMALFGLSDLSAGSLQAAKDAVQQAAKDAVLQAANNGEQLLYQDAFARVMGGMGGTLGDYEALSAMLFDLKRDGSVSENTGEILQKQMEDLVTVGIGDDGEEEVSIGVAPKLPDDAGARLQEQLNQVAVIVPVLPDMTAFNDALAAVGAAAVATAPRSAAGNSSTSSSRTYNSSRSMYIDKYNVYSGADISDLMAAMDAQNRYERMGRGA